MSDPIQASDAPGENLAQEQAQQTDEPSLAEVAARRLAARSQWQKALARAKERFTPVNLRDEAVHTAADKIGTAADKVGTAAWAHRGKLAVAGLLGGVFLARKPIAEKGPPLVKQVRSALSTTADAIRARIKP